MSTPHVHVKYIIAKAEGLQVEYQPRSLTGEAWRLLRNFREFDEPTYRFRLAPHRWQAEKDAQAAGKRIQYLGAGGAWLDGNYGVSFDTPGVEFRVKPETIKYRLYKHRDSNGSVCVEATDNADMDSFPSFIEWIGGWQEVEA